DQPRTVCSPALAVHAVHRDRPREHVPRVAAPVCTQPAVVIGRRNTARFGFGPRCARQFGGHPGLVCGDGAGLRRDHAAVAEASLVMPEGRMRSSLVAQSWVQAGRLLIEWRRERAVLVGSLIVPVCLLFVYVVVLDERVHKITGVASVYALVPVCAVLSGVFGALSTSLGIAMERDSGLLSRMWVLPVHRASALIGRLTAEAVRALLGTVLITALGLAMGLRFTYGWATVLVYVLIPTVMVV